MKTNIQQWMEKMEEVYNAEDGKLDRFVDRVLRAKGSADQIVITYVMMAELRRIRELLEAQGKAP